MSALLRNAIKFNMTYSKAVLRLTANSTNMQFLTNYQQHHYRQHRNASGNATNYSKTKKNPFTYVALTLSGIAMGYFLFDNIEKLKRNEKVIVKNTTIESNQVKTSEDHSEEESYYRLMHTTERTDLPTFKLTEVQKHNSLETGVWVTYGIGVYDITKFVPKHPKSGDIMLGAGSAIDPFWAAYELHNTKGILKFLEKFRIGNISPDDEGLTDDIDTPRSEESDSTPTITEVKVAEASTSTDSSYRLMHSTERKDLPTFQLGDIQKHNSMENGVWVTYGIGVYDITTFISKHPGNDKIMLGAGSAIDPFWAIYQQHNTEEILKLLETFRIGNISPDDEVTTDDMGMPWAHEPKRHPLLKAASERPFNAEPPITILADNFYTPNEFFYVRNHLPVPVMDGKTYELDVEIETPKAGAAESHKSLSYEDIKTLPKHTVTAAIMCGGNRRSEMTQVKSVKGLSWGAGAVGNAKWSGARLRDVLLAMGVKPNEELHVIFEGGDLDPTSNPYGASIPLSKALDERGDVILAYEMNGKPLNRDHGYPLRVIVPGTVGARNVKWLTRIVVADHESNSHWQQNDYKGFSPSTDWDTVDFTKSPAIQAMPVTSAICTPAPGEKVNISKDGFVEVKGYAWSGGGRRIVRVDLTLDKGKSWHVATLEQENEPDGRHYGWSLWTARIPVDGSLKGEEVEIWSKAVDSAYNVQPEKFDNIWNLRGVLSNAYHRVKILLN